MCGIAGVWNARKAAELTVVGLHANQHRAIDYAGIVSTDGQNIFRHGGKGLARQAFSDETLNKLHGRAALGHIRYPTVLDAKDDTRDNIQPIQGNYDGVSFAIAHNGNLTNEAELMGFLPGLKRSTSMDSEYFLRLIERGYTGHLEDDIITAVSKLKGSYCFGILFPDRLIVIRDKTGCRPVSIGKLGESYFFSSESCAFPNLGAEYIGDVEAGTMVTFSDAGMKVRRFAKPDEKKCRFEAIYFSHPSSRVFDENVTRFRMAMGVALEEAHPVPGADIVTAIPDSSNFIADGFARSGRSGVRLQVILRNHYVGRTFIAADHLKRSSDVAQKFNFTTEEIAGKKIVVIDDSIVRGTTLPKIVSTLRELKAREVHVRIGCPPIMHPCRYGVNTPTYEELAAVKYSRREIQEQTGADSLEYLPLEILKTLSPKPESFCFACMDGKYWD